ncbi:hypothetical protein PQ610_01570 [Tardisphaera miroshnichenkoae]
MKVTTIVLRAAVVVLLITTAAFANMYITQGASYQSSLNKDKSTIALLQSEMGLYESAAALSTAMSHFNYVAIENVTYIMDQYTSDATLHWIGGPLNGNYQGRSSIEDTWDKFTSTYETIYWYTISPPTTQQINSSDYLVSAPVQFLVAPTKDPEVLLVLNVSETLNLVKSNASQLGFLISEETWKVSPVALPSVIAGYPSQTTLIEDQVLSSAYAHWNNIAIENTTLISSGYSQNAVLNWVGGPLHGKYTGISSITSVWNKFVSTYEYVMWYAEEPPYVTLQGTTAVAKAQLQFLVFPFNSSTNTSPHAILLNVNDTLTFSYTGTTWLISSETWQVSPAPLYSAAPGYAAPTFT